MRRTLVVAAVMLCSVMHPGEVLALPIQKDGLVDVAVGNLTIADNVRVEFAGDVGGAICDKWGEARDLAETVDGTDNDATVCTLRRGIDVRFMDND